MLGSRLFIFGGQIDGEVREFNLNSRTISRRCFDSISPQYNRKPDWDSYEPTPGDEKPPPRISHVLVTTGDRIILLVPLSLVLVVTRLRFGGADSRHHYNDTWYYVLDTSTTFFGLSFGQPSKIENARVSNPDANRSHPVPTHRSNRNSRHPFQMPT
jgi:hypothetical protein